MADRTLFISPKTKVGELLDTYPALEPVLMSMSPAFEKLRNPVLRKTVARVATLQQVSVVGGVNIEEMIKQLRAAAGQTYDETGMTDSDPESADTPEWFDIQSVTSRFDATPVINSGESPMQEILRLASGLRSGEILELTAPFTPAPITDMLRSKGFKTFKIVNKESVKTYICK